MTFTPLLAPPRVPSPTNGSFNGKGSSSTVTEINSMELNVPVNIQTPWHAIYDFTFETVSSQKNKINSQ